MMKKNNKKMNSVKEETPNNDKDDVVSKDNEKDFVDLDWIFDKGWLRTKK